MDKSYIVVLLTGLLLTDVVDRKKYRPCVPLDENDQQPRTLDSRKSYQQLILCEN